MSSPVSATILEQNRKDLGKTRRIVGKAIAHAMVSGDESWRAMAWQLAGALDAENVEVEYPIRNALKEIGADYDQAWVRPSGSSGVPAPVADDRLELALSAMVKCAWEMSFHSEPAVRLWSREITEQLDRIGLNIDDRIDALSRRSGRGPDRFDVHGLSYDLTRQHVDALGKRWEHTGSWTDTEVPVMRRDEPDGESLTLPNLVRERGPLFAITPPARSIALGSDEPPF